MGGFGPEIAIIFIVGMTFLLALTGFIYYEIRQARARSLAFNEILDRWTKACQSGGHLPPPTSGRYTLDDVLARQAATGERRKPKIITEEREAQIERRAAEQAQKDDPIFL